MARSYRARRARRNSDRRSDDRSMRLREPSARRMLAHVPATAAVDPQHHRAGIAGLLGKNVFVTGGSSGIGQAIAVRFAEHGANVAINYLTTPEEAAGTEEQVHACVRRVQQQGVRDVLVGATSPARTMSCAWSARRPTALGGIDILVNNAGIQISRRPRSSPARTSTGWSRSTCAARSSAPARRSRDSWRSRRRAS